MTETPYIAATGAVLTLLLVIPRFIPRRAVMDDELVDFNADDECDALGTPVDTRPTLAEALISETCPACRHPKAQRWLLCTPCGAAARYEPVRHLVVLLSEENDAAAWQISENVIRKAKTWSAKAACN